MAEVPVQSELVSAEFPANSENNRDPSLFLGFQSLVPQNSPAIPQRCRSFPYRQKQGKDSAGTECFETLLCNVILIAVKAA